MKKLLAQLMPVAGVLTDTRIEAGNVIEQIIACRDGDKRHCGDAGV